jgi:spermidine synthase
VSVPALRGADPLFALLHRALGDAPALLVAARWAILTIILLVPTVLMGATLPLLTARVERGGFGAGLARLYAVNTFGAVAGTLLAALVIVPSVGLLASALVASAANLLAGIVAWVRRERGEPREATIAAALRAASASASANARTDDTSGVESGEEFARERSRPGGTAGAPSRIAPPRLGFAIALIALSGFAALVLEVCWTRILVLVIGSSVHSFAFVLAAYLFGIALGSALWARRVASTTAPLALFAWLEIALGALVLPQLFLVPLLPAALFGAIVNPSISLPAFLAVQALLAALLVAPPCVLLGALFPLGARLLYRGDAAAATGLAYLANTAGTIAGSIAAGFLLIPAIGSRATLIAGALTPIAIGIAALLASDKAGAPARNAAESSGVARQDARRSSRIALWTLAGAAAYVALVLAAAPRWDLRLLTAGVFRPAMAGSITAATDSALPISRRIEAFVDTDSILFFREGMNATVSLQRAPTGNIYLKIGGKTDASLADRETMVLFGHLPMLFARDGAHAMVIGHGSGMTLASVLAHAPASVNVLELEDAVLTASRAFHAPGEDPLDDPRVRVVVEDGRTYLADTRERFDAILSQPSNPWLAGMSNLFTRDFYQLVHARLAEGGVFAQWIQLYEMSAETLSSMLAAFRSVFPDAHLFITEKADLILVAPAPAAPFRAERLRDERVRASLAHAAVSPPERVLAYYACDLDELPPALVAGPANTDDNVFVEYRAPIDLLTVGRRAILTGAPASLAASVPRVFPVPFVSDLDARASTRLRGEGLALQGNFSAAEQAIAWLASNGARADADSLAEFIEVARFESRSASLAAEAARLTQRGPEGVRELETRLRALVAAQPDDAVARFYLGVIALQSGRAEEADSLFAFVARTTRGAPAARASNNRGLIAASRGDIAAAIAFFEESRRTRPDLPESYLFEAQVRANAGDLPGARATLEAGLAVSPADPRLLELRSALAR